MSMHGWQVSELGEPEQVMRLTELEIPVPGPGQVLLEVRAVALNFPDALMIRGQYQDRPPLPFTPGIELCGEVVDLGEGVAADTHGRRMIGGAALPHGGLAQYAVADYGYLYDPPSSFSDAQGAAFSVAYRTGWLALYRRARVQPGENVLVFAAAGGVGSAAVHLAKAAGARVVAVVGDRSKAAVATELGADAVVVRADHKDQAAFVAALKAVLGRGGADVVYDPVGGEMFTAATKVAAFEGRILVIGFAAGSIGTLAMNHPLMKNYSVMGVLWGAYRARRPELEAQATVELAALVEQGMPAPLVSREVAFDDAAAAVQDLAAGRTTGRVVVEPA